MRKTISFVLAVLMIFASACDAKDTPDVPVVSGDTEIDEELPVFSEAAEITWLIGERTVSSPDGTVTEHSKFEYDEVGNVMLYSSEDPYSTYRFVKEYNDRGYVEKEYTYINGEENHVVEYFYDEIGNVIKILETMDGKTLGYHKDYDEKNRMVRQIFTSLTEANVYETLKSVVYTYNDEGRRIEETEYDAQGNVTMHFYEVYDDQGRVIHRYSDNGDDVKSGYDYYYSEDENGNTVMSTKLRDDSAVICEETTNENGKEIKCVSYNKKGEAESIRITEYNEDGYEVFCSYDYLPDKIDNEYTCTTEYDERGNIKSVRVVVINEGKESVTETTYNGKQRVNEVIIDGVLYSTETLSLSDHEGYYTSYLYVDLEKTVEHEYKFDKYLNPISIEMYVNGELISTETLSWVACKNYNPYRSAYN